MTEQTANEPPNTTEVENFKPNEEHFRLLVQSVKDYGIFMLDPAGHIMTWNEGAQRIKGYAAKDIIGKHFSTFYPDEDNAWGKPAYELVVAAREGRFEDEGWRIRKDGSRFWANVIITALRDETGTLVGYGKVTRDLTERRSATEKAIEDAKRLAEMEAANRTKAEFLASMSHELRTPLNAIGGYVDLLIMGIRGPVTEAQKSDLDRIRRSQQHLLSVINDILNFSKIEAGGVVYNIKPVSITDSLKTIESAILPQIEMKGLKYKRISCGDNTMMLVDQAKAEQIFINLLSNAIKFTDNGGTITIECSTQDHTVTLKVCDTGTGIEADKLDAIFEPFVQVGRSLANPGEGTGLGLAISRDLAHAMHGDITVESKVGAGSTFTVTLPRAVKSSSPI